MLGNMMTQCPAPQTLASREKLGAAGLQQPLSTDPSARAGQITPQLFSQPEGELKAMSAVLGDSLWFPGRKEGRKE